MRKLILLFLLLSSDSFANEPTTKLPPETYEIAKKFGVYDKIGLKLLNRKKASQIDIDKHARINEAILSDIKSVEAGRLLDETLGRIVDRVVAVYEARGDRQTASRIEAEYRIKFLNFYENAAIKEMGDHEYLSEWLHTVHDKIHNELGDQLCKFLHTHDLFIINFGVPVIRAPESFDLPEYTDHFAGHMDGPYYFIHHGVAGVVTYWTVNAVCSAGTAGMGAAVFACSPIASLAEFAMDKHISPKLALKVWTRYH